MASSPPPCLYVLTHLPPPSHPSVGSQARSYYWPHHSHSLCPWRINWETSSTILLFLLSTQTFKIMWGHLTLVWSGNLISFLRRSLFSSSSSCSSWNPLSPHYIPYFIFKPWITLTELSSFLIFCKSKALFSSIYLH